MLPVNEKASFGILPDIYEGGEEVLQKDKVLAGEVHFKVTYKDTYYNEYEQEYMFQYVKSMGIGRVETYLPHAIRKK